MKRVLRALGNVMFIVLGILSAGMGLKGFLLSSRFIDGGVTGVSMLLAGVVGLPLSVWLLIVNLPFVAVGFFQLGKRFAIKSALAIAGLAVCLVIIPYPDVTSDKLLTAVFGGFFIGAGIGLAIRGGAVLDGTEIAALLVSRSSHLLKVGDVILILNIFIFLSAAFFLGIDVALYSILTYATASRMIDFLLHGIEEYTAITIISPEYKAIKDAIMNDLHRGLTVYRGHGGLGSTGVSDSEQEILFCVVTRLEIHNVKKVVEEIDPTAFVTTHALSDVQGGLIKKPMYH
ncbi:MAG TPA: YitT family protein [Pyrinomonadaceae bacterium]|nr:YitT family protein [Pyrinomonadaceae bacterium]